MNTTILEQVARQMVQSGKGLLAADESAGTATQRFESEGIHSTEETRRAYREILITTPGVEDYLAGIILVDETIRQQTHTGIPFVDVLKEKGIIPGIKVDKGTKQLALHEGETIAEGLDGLRERLVEYKELGAKFAKWRAALVIGDKKPTEGCIDVNTHALARYAALCQEADIVPIVEPEVLIDGDHTIERAYEVNKEVLTALFMKLKRHKVHLPGVILKPSMITSGNMCSEQALVEKVADMTIRCFQESVPTEVPGIAFLSGGQSTERATAHLNAMHTLYKDLPWQVTFSFSRALHSPALKIWAQDPAQNTQAAQKMLLNRAKLCSLASLGQYDSSMENES